MRNLTNNLEVPKFAVKKSNSPKYYLRENKENQAVMRYPIKLTGKALPKYQLSHHDQNLQNQTQPLRLTQFELSTDYDPKSLHTNHLQIYNRILEKITSQANFLDIEETHTRPPSIHRQKIIEKLSKGNLRTSAKDRTKICSDNLITVKNNENNKCSTNSSGSSHNIWEDGGEKDLALFDFYQFRYENYPHQKAKINAVKVIKNMKLLMGANLEIEGLGSLPWYTFDLQDQYKSHPNMMCERDLPFGYQAIMKTKARKNIMLQQYLRDKCDKDKRVDHLQDLLKRQPQIMDQGLRIHNMRLKLRPKPRGVVCYSQHDQNLRKLSVTNDPPIVARNLQLLGSPEILMKNHLLKQLLRQQRQMN